MNHPSLSSEWKARLAQQLRTDRLLGQTQVPLISVDEALAARQRMPSTEPHRDRGSEANQAPPSGGAAAKASLLADLNESQVADCRNCRLFETRTQTVFGQGHADARLLFVGEAPGYHEDQQGLAFVGKAGEKLTGMIQAMTLTRDDVYICNVIKCRPPGNRDPMADEILACSPYLRQQIAIVQPEVIVALGAPASKTLLKTAQSIGKLRGRFHDYFVSGTSGVGPAIPLMPTYHPAYLLRNPSDKKKTWEDLQLVMSLLGLKRTAG